MFPGGYVHILTCQIITPCYYRTSPSGHELRPQDNGEDWPFSCFLSLFLLPYPFSFHQSFPSFTSFLFTLKDLKRFIHIYPVYIILTCYLLHISYYLHISYFLLVCHSYHQFQTYSNNSVHYLQPALPKDSTRSLLGPIWLFITDRVTELIS